MANSGRHGLARYNAGCRCDQCKQATSEYHKARRRRIAESAGDVAEPAHPDLSLVRVTKNRPVTSINVVEAQQTPANSVVAGVQAEIEQFGGQKRPALAAAALALAAVLDDPKAVSTKPAAAAKLSDLLEQMRKSADNKKSKLASVRAMTSGNTKTG